MRLFAKNRGRKSPNTVPFISTCSMRSIYNLYILITPKNYQTNICHACFTIYNVCMKTIQALSAKALSKHAIKIFMLI